MICAPYDASRPPPQFPPSLAEIDAEIARREKRPKSPAVLAQLASRGHWKSVRHLELLNERLAALADRRITRLIVTMPPRHGKSELCSRFFPAWYLGTHPEHRVILCSYEADFAAEWGGKARDVLEAMGDLFGVSVRHDSSARDAWNISGRVGGMNTAGVGGPITGKGAHLLVLDDPIKNAEEAHSQTYREKIWNWWRSTAYTRLEPDGIALIVLTRWDQDDIAGRLIKQNSEEDAADNWEVLNLPAIAEDDDPLGREPGEALWPDRYDVAKLQRICRHVGLYVWNALFQQHPTPLEGGYFKRHWFRSIAEDRVPELVHTVRSWDLAATAEDEGGDPDWLVGTKMGESSDGKKYIIGVKRLRISAANVESEIVQTAASDGHGCSIRIQQEGAASGKLLKVHWENLLSSYDCRFTPIPRASKLTRAAPYNAACERGDVLLVEGEWIEAFVEEHATFPNGGHDDQVDATAEAYNFFANLAEVADEFFITSAN